MSKMQCRCGAVISDVQCPCPTEGRLIGDQDFELMDREFVSQVDAFLTAVRDGNRELWIRKRFSENHPLSLSDGEIISDLLCDVDLLYSRSIAECETCGRLWVQTAVGENRYRSFAPDENGYSALLKSVAPS